jgi:hypothetical protein
MRTPFHGAICGRGTPPFNQLSAVFTAHEYTRILSRQKAPPEQKKSPAQTDKPQPKTRHEKSGVPTF